MPNSKLKLKPHLKRLSILNEHNECDEALLPDIEPDTLRSWYRAMVTARRFDARLLELQREGRIGTFAPVQGQEAAQIGAVSAIESTDWLVPSFRELAVLLYRGTPMHTLLMYDAGFNEGGQIAEKAHARSLGPDQLRGGTFTITNLAGAGGVHFTPLINPPQVAILGVATARWVAVVQDDHRSIAPRLLLPLILAFDHRVNDGMDAAHFASTLTEMLAAPGNLLLRL
jgi:hypothetical protein